MTRLHPTDLEKIIEGVAERVISRLSPQRVEHSPVIEFDLSRQVADDLAEARRRKAERQQKRSVAHA